ncbi:MAG: type II secretion system F family protein [Pirellulales bacterium]|nr:type II secretion system F family protein [Pirellulales bacterium]
MAPNEALIALAAFLFLVAAAAIWVRARSSANGRASGRLADAAKAAGWVLFLVAVFGIVGLLTQAFFILAWIITLVVLFSLLLRYRGMERRSLLWTLMVAADRGIPLEAAARAFAEERHDHVGSRALDLAEYLEAGLPLGLALKRSRLSFPPAILLAAELGQQTGDLGGALRQAMGQTDDSEVLLRSAAERLFYVLFLVLYGMLMCTFLLLKIVPIFEKIFSDFGAQLPAVTRWFVGTSDFLDQAWPLALLLVLLFVLVMVRSLSFYTGYSSHYLPGVSFFWGRADRGVILRWLAVAVRQNRPLADMMRLLAGYLHRRGLRSRLERAARRIEQGADWTDSLRRTGLIHKAEAALFESAERTGNLAWALEEMAASSARRSVYRLRAAINVVFPAVVLLAGAAVLFVALAILLPLYRLIINLT